MPYIQVKLKITPRQQIQALKGARIRLTADAIGSGQIVLLHPINAKKIATAKNGVQLELSPGEVMHTAHYHGLIPDKDMISGGGFFDSVWSGLKKAGQWLKDSGVGTILADAAVPLVAGVTGSPATATVARDVLRSATGVGLKGRGKGLYIGKGSGLYV